MNIEQLKKDIMEFESFKESLDRQQLTFPLDKKSYDVVHKDAIVPTGNVVEPYSLVTFDEAIEMIVKDKKYLLETSTLSFIP